MNAYRAEMPDVEIFTLVDNTSVIEKLILEDDRGVGLVERPIYSPFIESEKFSDADLIIIQSGVCLAVF